MVCRGYLDGSYYLLVAFGWLRYFIVISLGRLGGLGPIPKWAKMSEVDIQPHDGTHPKVS